MLSRAGRNGRPCVVYSDTLDRAGLRWRERERERNDDPNRVRSKPLPTESPPTDRSLLTCTPPTALSQLEFMTPRPDRPKNQSGHVHLILSITLGYLSSSTPTAAATALLAPVVGTASFGPPRQDPYPAPRPSTPAPPLSLRRHCAACSCSAPGISLAAVSHGRPIRLCAAAAPLRVSAHPPRRCDDHHEIQCGRLRA